MNVARRSEGVLAADGIVRLVEAVGEGYNDPEALAQMLRIAESASLERTRNTLTLLGELGVLDQHQGRARISSHFSQGTDLRGRLREAIYFHYRLLIRKAELGSAFQMGDEGNELWVDRLQLPFRDLGYPYLLLQFEIAFRSSSNERFWLISPDIREDLLSLLAELNSRPHRKHSFSHRSLKRLLEAQELAGRRAEEFVVKFEQERLHDHCFKYLIRSIANEDAGAGFDILSFETNSALIHDRFIEVKSYKGEPAFYWSPEEMEAAQTLGNRYWLYLIDRDVIDRQGYSPEMVQDPHTYFLVHQPEGWMVEPKSFKFSRTQKLEHS